MSEINTNGPPPIALRPRLADAMKAVDAQERVDDRAERARLEAASVKLREDEHTIRAGAINLLIVRANQTGRDFFSPVDSRRLDLVMRACMDLPSKDEKAAPDPKIAPQSQPEEEVSETVKRLEAAVQGALEAP